MNEKEKNERLAQINLELERLGAELGLSDLESEQEEGGMPVSEDNKRVGKSFRNPDAAVADVGSDNRVFKDVRIMPGTSEFGMGFNEAPTWDNSYHGDQSEASTSGEASSLLINEREEPLTEEDLLLYQLRKAWTGLPQNDALEMMESRQAPLLSAWNEGDAAGLSTDRLYLQLSKHLQGGKVTEEALEEMAMLSGKEKAGNSGMKLFLSAFTLLQNNPSRYQMDFIADKTSCLPGSDISSEGVRILGDAIWEAGSRQDTLNTEYDQKNIARQKEYDRLQEKAQEKYNNAHQRAERWRK